MGQGERENHSAFWFSPGVGANDEGCRGKKARAVGASFFPLTREDGMLCFLGQGERENLRNPLMVLAVVAAIVGRVRRVKKKRGALRVVLQTAIIMPDSEPVRASGRPSAAEDAVLEKKCRAKGDCGRPARGGASDEGCRGKRARGRGGVSLPPDRCAAATEGDPAATEG